MSNVGLDVERQNGVPAPSRGPSSRATAGLATIRIDLPQVRSAVRLLDSMLPRKTETAPSECGDVSLEMASVRSYPCGEPGCDLQVGRYLEIA